MASVPDRANDSSRSMGTFFEGKKPSMIDIHEAYIGGKIAKEEGQDLNPKWDPDKVVSKYKTGHNRLQRHIYDDLVKARKKGSGNYNYKKKEK